MSRDITQNLRNRIIQLQGIIEDKNRDIERLVGDLQSHRKSLRVKEQIKSEIERLNSEIDGVRDSIRNVERRIHQLVEE